MTEVVESPLAYAADGQGYVGLLLKPGGGTSSAAVALLPDWRGQSALARDHARHLVALGCMVVIVDLYGDGFNPDSPDQVGPMVQRLIAHRDRGVAALASCVEALRQQAGARTPVFCLGYSAGGMVALDYGRSGADVAGIIVCSALLKTAEPGKPTRIEAPVLALQGTQDVVSPMEMIAAVIREMDAAGNDFRFELYGQTHHAFDNPEAGSDPGARLVYSAQSALWAQRAIAGFLAEHGRV
ncbi:alpha/beta fold hydrolase [Frateuria sp. Soil773]|uniref:dienelactone hydrolase family protein n=1 Tax=Frateuria sp. Soil773 TaxID=1736407 RepID=UPI0009E6A4AE|nr:alpha/beta fold hydrolase [Frateuria sp. Soil773]